MTAPSASDEGREAMEARLHPVGERRDMTPIPPLPEHTTYFELGPLIIGVEVRRFNDEVLSRRLAGDAEASEITAELFREKGVDRASIDDTGVSLHVFDRETNEELLRFDGFSKDPHYHYITPGSHHVAIGFDDAANGDFLEWAFRALLTRAPDMLRTAGATALADRVDVAALAEGIDDVRAAAGLPPGGRSDT